MTPRSKGHISNDGGAGGHDMRIGFITDLTDEDFRFAQQMGVCTLEYNENGDDVEHFLSQVSRLKGLCRSQRIRLGVIGRFGRNYISHDSDLARGEITHAECLMKAAADLGASVFVTGAGHGEQRDHKENCRRAVDVLGRFVDLGKTLDLKVALYTCPWGNFAFSPSSWRQILPEVPGLGIKYDPSHAYYDGRDWLAEMRDWGGRFSHTHAKGCLRIDGQRLEDPMPGMDQLNWGAFFAMLHHHNYAGDVMIEPHSDTWNGQRRYAGLRFSINYLRQFIV
jgi:sugar phosphate isomerase/epimerase